MACGRFADRCGGEALDRWRASIRGICSDQGVEVGLCDLPDISRPEEMMKLLQSDGPQDLVQVTAGSSYFFPNALLVMGPLHIIWNAFESCISGLKVWPEFRELLSGILGFLGNRGLRRRFVEVCMQDCSADVKSDFDSWRHKVADWKWQYVEETFQRLSPILSLFLERFDAHRIKVPIGHRDASGGNCIDPGCMSKIEAAKDRAQYFAAMVEALAVFSKACGREARRCIAPRPAKHP